MLFSSNVFLHLFLPLLLALYFVMPRFGRNVLLLAASLLFYAWGEPALVLLMIASAAMNWLFGRWIGEFRGTPSHYGLLTFGVGANLALLGYFKYAGFLVESLNALLVPIGLDPLAVPAVRLPIGISFYTFQAISYLIDVSRGEVKAEPNPLNVALYIALFPQLIAGPIVRYVQIADELHHRRETTGEFAHGVQRFVVGLGKKMLIANPLSVVADSAFDVPAGQLSLPVAWLGIAAYTMQIYFDFSGYSDMGIGLGRMFGFTFCENFRYPYVAQSVTDFWRRWHMSLSTWFRDYLYIPLGGNRRGAWRTSLNLLTVFLLCGLWHGASWTFVAWGLYHGGFLMLERRGLGALLERLARPLRHAYTLLAVMVGWVLFRASDFTHALGYLKAMSGLGLLNDAEFHIGLFVNPGVALTLAAAVIGSTPFVPWLGSLIDRADGKRPMLAVTEAVSAGRLIALGTVLVLSSAMLAAGTHNPFIYFRF
jgi:alginate O-acetyltransferase complex protein AlgI